jgi:hypothetical protein
VRFVADKVALGQVFLPVLRFPLSVLFHQCYILIFVYTVLLLGQMGEAFRKPMLSRKSENTHRKPLSGATLPITNPTGHAVWYMLRTKWHWDRFFSPVPQFSPSQYRSINATYSSPFICSYQKDERASENMLGAFCVY